MCWDNAAVALSVGVLVDWRRDAVALTVRVLVRMRAAALVITRAFTRAAVAGITRCDSARPTE